MYHAYLTRTPPATSPPMAAENTPWHFQMPGRRNAVSGESRVYVPTGIRMYNHGRRRPSAVGEDSRLNADLPEDLDGTLQLNQALAVARERAQRSLNMFSSFDDDFSAQDQMPREISADQQRLMVTLPTFGQGERFVNPRPFPPATDGRAQTVFPARTRPHQPPRSIRGVEAQVPQAIWRRTGRRTPGGRAPGYAARQAARRCTEALASPVWPDEEYSYSDGEAYSDYDFGQENIPDDPPHGERIAGQHFSYHTPAHIPAFRVWDRPLIPRTARQGGMRVRMRIWWLCLRIAGRILWR
jgi:hypothetical protein